MRTAYLDAVNYTIAWGPRANCRRWLFHVPRCKLASRHGISIVVVFLRLLALQHCISIAFMLPRELDAWDGAPRIVLVDMADCLLGVLLFLLCCELALHSCSLIGLHLRGNSLRWLSLVMSHNGPKLSFFMTACPAASTPGRLLAPCVAAS